jgi:uncharacterized membrane protein YuzA (DUF378 family)
MTGGKCCAVCNVVGVLVALGAINWGLVGLFQYDLVGSLLGTMSGASRAVYTIIGIAGILKILSVFKLCPCQKGSCEPKS